MFASFRSFYYSFRLAFASHSDLLLEILVLRHQLAVYQRQVARPTLREQDRFFWTLLSRLWPRWRTALFIVQPDTVVRWHHRTWKRYWSFRSRHRGPGRPRISAELRELILRMAKENAHWGTKRIRGELQALGFDVGAETVRRYRHQARRRPPSQTWRTFLANHATKAALAEGIVPGGGLAFVRMADAVSAAAVACEGDQRTGLRIIARALEVPARQLAENSGVDPGVVLERIRGGTGTYGFDSASGEYVDLIEAGIIDPTKVVRIALQNAISIAGTLLLTEATVTEMPDEKKERVAAPGFR